MNFFNAKKSTAIVILSSTLAFLGFYQIANCTNYDVADYTFTSDATLNAYDTLNLRGASSTNNYQLNNGSYGEIDLYGTTTLTNSSIGNPNGSFILRDNATAANSTIANDYALLFYGSSTAANSVINNTGNLSFFGSSKAGTSHIINNDGYVTFNNISDAQNATITNSGDGVYFYNTPSTTGLTIINGANGKVYLDSVTPTGIAIGSFNSTDNTGTISLGGKALTIGALNQSDSINGTLVGTGSITKVGTGTLDMNTNYSGHVYVNAGTLKINNDYSGLIDVNSGTLAVNNNNLTNKLKVVNGTANLSNANLTYSGLGVSNQDDGIFNADSSSVLSTNFNNSGTATFSNNSSIAGNLTNLYPGTVIFNDSSHITGSRTIYNENTINFNGTSTAGNSSISGYGTINFNNSSKAGTGYILNDGLLYFNDLSDAQSTTIENENAIYFNNTPSAVGATINNTYGSIYLGGIDSEVAIGAYSSNNSDDSRIHMGGKTMRVGALNQTDTIADEIDGNGSIIKIGTGILNMNTDYSGHIYANSGTVNINHDNYSGPIDVAGGTLVINNNHLLNPVNLTGGTANLTNTNLTYNGLGVNNQGGIFNANSGVILSTNLSNNGAANFIGSSTIAGNVTNLGSGTVTFNNTSSITGNSSITNAGIAVFKDTSSITGNSSIITNLGSGTVTFKDASSITGSNSIINNAGTALFKDITSIGNATVNNTGTLDFNNLTSPGISIGAFNSTGTINTGNKDLMIGSKNLTDTISGTINGGGRLIKEGTGVLNISTDYIGKTVLRAGTINVIGSSVSNLGVIPDGQGGVSRNIEIANGSNFKYSGTASSSNTTITNDGHIDLSDTTTGTTIGSLDSTGIISIANKTLTIGALNIPNTIAGTISGNGTIKKVGTEVLDLDTDHSGSIILSDGTLNLNDHSSSDLTVQAGTAFYKGTATADNARIVNMGGMIDISGITLPAIEVGSIEGSGDYYLGNKKLIAGSNNLNTVVSGVISNDNGFYIKTGTGTTTLAGANTYVGGTEVQMGTLLIDGSIMSPVTVDAIGTLGGIGTIDGTVTNSGVIAPGNASIGTLTINDIYTGNNGKLMLRLAGINHDKLAINGGANGTTSVILSGAGTEVDPNGIQIIQTMGSANNAFTLSTQTQGAYNYVLKYNGITSPTDHDWYLTSQLREDFNIHNTIAPVVARYATLSMGSFQDRTSPSLYQTIPGKDSKRVWMRAFGSFGKQAGNDLDNDQNSKVGYKSSDGGIQIGQTVIGDYSNSKDSYIAGFYGSVGHSRVKESDPHGTSIGKNNIYSIGSYATYRGADRWFVDLIAQVSKYDITSSTFFNDVISPRGYGLGLSAEFGYPIKLQPNLMLEPQGQIIYQAIDLKKTKNATSTVTFSDNNSLITKVGAKLSYNVKMGGDNARTITPEAKINLWHDFNKRSSITIGGLNNEGAMRFTNKNETNWIEYGLGVKGSATNNMEIFANVDYKATPNFKSYNTTAKVGAKFYF